MAGAGALVIMLATLSIWNVRILIGVVAVGIGLIVKSTRMFAAVAQTAPLPDARLNK
jgi:hypothetical protein